MVELFWIVIAILAGVFVALIARQIALAIMPDRDDIIYDEDWEEFH